MKNLRAEERFAVEIATQEDTVFTGRDDTLALNANTAWSTGDVTCHVFVLITRSTCDITNLHNSYITLHYTGLV